MTNEVNNLAHSFVAMAQAYEELPKVKEQLNKLEHENHAYLDMVQEREASILRLKSELEASHEARRKVEAERDDAEFRFLESEDRVASAMSFLKSTFGSAGSLIQALEPPAPAAVPVPPAEPEVIHEAVWSGSPDPVSPDTHWINDATGERIPTDAPTPSQGQSEPDPTTAATSQGQVDHSVNSAVTQSENVTSSGTTQQGESASSPTSAPPAPTGTGMEPEASSSNRFAGVMYYDHPVYIPREEWVANGGTDYTYDWRPASSNIPTA